MAVTPNIQVTLTSDAVELGTGVTALTVLKARNMGTTTQSVVVACAINTSPGKESSRAWTSPTVSGVTGNDASGTGSISDTVSIAAGKEVTYFIVHTLAVLGAYTHSVTTLKATATISSVLQDTAMLRLFQGDMDYVTFKPGVNPNAVQIAEMLFDVNFDHPEFADWLENAGGKTVWDLIN